MDIRKYIHKVVMSATVGGMLVSCGVKKRKEDVVDKNIKEWKEFSIKLPDGWKVQDVDFGGIDAWVGTENDSVYVFVNHTKTAESVVDFSENRFKEMMYEINAFDVDTVVKSDTMCLIVYRGEEEMEEFRQMFCVKGNGNGKLYGLTGDFTVGDSTEVLEVIKSFTIK